MNKKSEEGTIINIAGRQRMLSQRINLLLLRSNDQTHKAEIDSLTQLWKKNHLGMLETNPLLGYSSISNTKAKAILEDISVELIQVIELAKNDTHNGNFNEVNLLVDKYLIQMDQVVFILSNEADRRLAMIVIIELVLFSISIMMLLIEMKIIFLPVVNRLGKTIDEKDVLLAEKKSNILWKHTEYLKSLHAITISKDSSNQKIEDILSLVQSYLNLPIGIVSHIEGEHYTVAHCTENNLSISRGDTYSLSNTICDITLNHVKPNVMFNDQYIFYDKDLKNSLYSDHKAVKGFPLKTHIGVALRVNNKFYGTVNFSSVDVRESYEEEEILMFLQAKEAIVYELQRIERRKLQKENEQLALVAKATHNSILITDDKGLITWANEGFTRITGYTLDEAIGQKPGDFLQGESSDNASKKLMSESIKNEKAVYVEMINYNKDGTPYWVSIDLQPIFNRKGKLEKFMAIQSDITDQVALRVANEQLAVVAKKTSNGVIISDKSTSISWVNDGFSKLTGYSSEEIVGSDLESLFVNQKIDSSALRKLKKAIKEGSSLKMEVMNCNNFGDPYWVSLDLQPIKNEDGKIDRFVLLETDITEKLNKQNNELLGEIRGEEKERNRISKDLHDGVGQMLVASRMLLNKLKPTTPMEVILNQKKVLDSLFEEMILETRMVINNLEVSLGKSNNLKEAIENLISKSKRIFEGEIVLKWQGEESFPDFVFAMNLFRITQEALSNSIKYSFASKIDINFSNNGSLKFEIKDNGEGFDVDEYNQIAGSGINNMRTRAENMDLKFFISSKKNAGTQIIIHASA
ncbi:PAS domain-containing protein [Ekhidna sp.]